MNKMDYNTGCKCCDSEESQTVVTESNIYEEEDTRCEVVANIWRNKMIQSGLFFPAEIEHTLAVWMEFLQKRFQLYSHKSAEQFYMSTVMLCAQQLKHYVEHGWECLLRDYVQNPPMCLENSIEEQELKPQSVVSDESSGDIHAQVEFFLQLVASSNLSLYLARTALGTAFVQNINYAKSPSKVYKPRNYLNSDLESLDQAQIRKNLIYGAYDGYILPLQIASEVNDEFWQREIAEIRMGKLSRNSTFY